MEDLPILSIVTLFVVFISLLFAIFLFTVKTKRKLSNILIGCYFIIMAIHISTFFYGYYFERVPLVFDMVRDQVIYLSHPLLYLYVLSAIYNDFRLSYTHLLHLLPFLLIIAIFYTNFYGVNKDQQNIFYENFLDNPEIRFSSIFGYAVIIFYLFLIFKELFRYRKLLLENYSYSGNFNYKWLFQLTVLISIVHGLTLYKNIYRYIGEDIEHTHYLRIIITLVLLGFLSWIVLKSMYYPELFRGINSNLVLVKNLVFEQRSKNVLESKKYHETQAQTNKQISMLEDYMSENKPFLDSALTIQSLASKVDIPVKDLSVLINHSLNQHFFDFVNNYRIVEAINILEDFDQRDLTILEILYHVGFNSKSSFHTAFKKKTGVTPYIYRKNHFAARR